jgi:hypothetical protein
MRAALAGRAPDKLPPPSGGGASDWHGLQTSARELAFCAFAALFLHICKEKKRI